MVHTFPIVALWLVGFVVPGFTRGSPAVDVAPTSGTERHVAVEEGDEAGRLAVTVSSLRSDEGHVRLLLFAGGTGFPDEPGRAVKRVSLPIKGRTARVVFDGLPAGEYAISVIHDENDNEALDTGLFGIPSEGFGASNNPKIRRGPPQFSEAAFRVEEEGVAVQMIRMRYF
jgi:uncharacterized protein (DUF2141 family)